MTKKLPRITYELLIAKGACSWEAEEFRGMFPKGVVPSKAKCLKYWRDLNFAWAIGHMISSEGKDEIHKKTIPLLRVYYAKPHDKDRPALVRYSKALAIAFGEAWLKENTEL